MTVVTGTLSLPFAAKFIVFPETGFPIQVSTRLPVALISIFGIAFLLYSYFALRDLQQHIVENWDHAIYARDPELKKPNGGSKAPWLGGSSRSWMGCVFGIRRSLSPCEWASCVNGPVHSGHLFVFRGGAVG
jgi:hypothetical protein